MDRQELIKKTNEYIQSLPKHYFTESETHFCKTIHVQRQQLKMEFESRHPSRFNIPTKISRNHSDDQLYFGLLCELLLCKYFNESRKDELNKDLLKEWAKDQIRQNEMVGKEGRFDCTDVGKTQVRAAEYSDTAPRRVIYRQNDFRTKAHQPVVGCVYHPTDSWAVICGFMSFEDLKINKSKYWGDPDKRGFEAMWIPLWDLTPIENFDVKYLC